MTQSLQNELQEQIRRLLIENRNLALQVQSLQKQLYGSRADKRPAEDSAQGKLEGIEEAHWQQEKSEPQSPARRKERKGKKKGPKPLSPDLARVAEQVPDPDLNRLVCPVSGRMLRVGFTETIEVLTRQPARHLVRSISRNVFVGDAGEAPVYSAWPADVLSKSRIDTSVIANLITSRFADHQPYYRQSGQLARLGVELAPNTIGSIVAQAYEKLQPLQRCLFDSLLQSPYIQLDPTPIPMMSKRKKGSTSEACLWAYRALDGPLVFKYSATKQGIFPAQALKDYQGRLQTDGATNFGGIPDKEGVIHLACWVHVRRYFLRALEAGEQAATQFLDRIDRLFYLERVARRLKVTPQTLTRLRQRHALGVVDEIFNSARDYAADQLLIKTPLPTAVKYLLGLEQPLRECFRHAPSRIDNNLVENSIRPLKLGARNWLFIGHPDAGDRAALMFTLVENCKLAGINPETYLADVLARIDDHPASRIKELTPQGWADTHHLAGK